MDLATGKPFGAASRNWVPPFTLASLAVIAVLKMIVGFRAEALGAAPPGSAAANSPRSGGGARGQ